MNTLTDEQLQEIADKGAEAARETGKCYCETLVLSQKMYNKYWEAEQLARAAFARTVIDLALSKMAEGEGDLVTVEDIKRCHKHNAMWKDRHSNLWHGSLFHIPHANTTMNPHNHPPKINSVAMDQLPTPRTDAQGYRKTSWVKRSFARTLERELLASQARERVLRSALDKLVMAAATCMDHCYGDGTVHHQSFDSAAIGAAVLEVRAVLNQPKL